MVQYEYQSYQTDLRVDVTLTVSYVIHIDSAFGFTAQTAPAQKRRGKAESRVRELQPLTETTDTIHTLSFHPYCRALYVPHPHPCSETGTLSTSI